MKMVSGLVLAAFLALPACAAPAGPDPAAPKPAPQTEAECTAQGGTMQPTGLSGAPRCVIPYKDAGKDCTTGEDCGGDCWVSSMAKPGADGKVHGQCQPTNMPFGCHARIEDGKIVGGILCVD